jgi:hypothetical protein
VQVIRGAADPVRRQLDGGVTRGTAEEFEAIPYYSWAHRGRRQMVVWIARETAGAKPLPAPTIAFLSKASSSAGTGLEAVTDQLLPKLARDRSIPVFHLYPQRGTREWVQLNFRNPQTISRATVYWYEDAHPRGCRLPAEWRITYLADGQWNDLQTATIARGETVTTLEFTPVHAEGARLEMLLQSEFSAGIYEWVIE